MRNNTSNSSIQTDFTKRLSKLKQLHKVESKISQKETHLVFGNSKRTELSTDSYGSKRKFDEYQVNFKFTGK